MTWRLHLTNHAIRSLSIIKGDPRLLAAWIRQNRVVYHDLVTGTPISEQTFNSPDVDDRSSEEWQTFVGGLTTPVGTYLPVVQTPRFVIHATDDGRMRLYHAGDAALYLDSEGREAVLDSTDATGFVAVALDRVLGLIAALDRGGKLYIYQQNILVGAFDLGLPLQTDLRPAVAVSQGRGSVFVTDGQRIVRTDSSGKVRKELDTHYFICLMACSPNGRYLATCDMETGVIRVYDGTDLSLSHQRFAIDLVAQATQVQLIANLPPGSISPTALTITDDGIIALAMSGVVCVTDLPQMDQLPRPQPLL